MASFNYGNTYPQQPPQNPLYPQIYNPLNAPQPGQPQPGQPLPGQPQPGQMPGQPQVQPVPGYPGQMPQYPYQPGFAVYPNQPPSALSYPGAYPMMPPAYGAPGVPHVAPQPSFQATVEWIATTPRDAVSLTNKAVVAGYEGYDHSPLWVIRARHEGDLIPGKLAIKHHAAYVAWGGKERAVQNIEVCCSSQPDKIRWVENRDGVIPPNAIIGGNTSSGEPLYIGRAKEQGSLTPGKVHPSHKVTYISFAGQEIAHKVYDILCTA